jgi:NhaP-type Na+/H+ or K+/H+ antiporter
MDDFLGLGLIGVVYGLSVVSNSWGFLAVFFAAVALRQTERRLAGAGPDDFERLQAGGSGESRPVVEPGRSTEAAAEPESARTVSQGSLVFKEQLERLSEVVLILLIGGTLFIDSWNWPAVAFALFLFFVARPVSVFAGLLGTGSTWRVRGLVGWFGVRGIGSLYYLMYAIQHGIPDELALELIHMTMAVVTLSIVFHGISVKPLMERFWSGRGRPGTP